MIKIISTDVLSCGVRTNSADVNVHMVLILIEQGVGSDLFLSFYNLKIEYLNVTE